MERQDFCEAPGVLAHVEGVIRVIPQGDLGGCVGDQEYRKLGLGSPLRSGRGQGVAAGINRAHSAGILDIRQALFDCGGVALGIVELAADHFPVQAAVLVDALDRRVPGRDQPAVGGGMGGGHVADDADHHLVFTARLSLGLSGLLLPVSRLSRCFLRLSLSLSGRPGSSG